MASRPQNPRAGNGMNDAKSSNWRVGAAIVAVCALVTVPLVVKQAPREVARWYHAAAVESRLDGHADRAYQQLATAAARDPRNLDLSVQRAIWLREDDRLDEALAACNSAIEANPDHVAARAERSQILQQLGRFAEAVEDWKSIAHVNERSAVVSEVVIWNALAYARAVANIELKDALADADRAVARFPDAAALLDTRGFLHYRLGNDADAKRDLDRAVSIAEAQRAPFKEGAPRKLPSGVDPREWPAELKSLDNELAVIIYHRSLVLERLGDQQGADADRDRVRQLGFTPDDQLF